MGRQISSSVTIEVKSKCLLKRSMGVLCISRQLHVLFHVAFVMSDIRKNVDTGVTVSVGRDRYWRRCVIFIHQTNYGREIREQTPLQMELINSEHKN